MKIIKTLKRRIHRDIAYAQDIMIEELYSHFNNAVFYGGTAIWRCYNGNRFSEDIDVYLPKDESKINGYFKALERRGFKFTKKRY